VAVGVGAGVGDGVGTGVGVGAGAGVGADVDPALAEDADVCVEAVSVGPSGTPLEQRGEATAAVNTIKMAGIREWLCMLGHRHSLSGMRRPADTMAAWNPLSAW
jgi:hypothetical protein